MTFKWPSSYSEFIYTSRYSRWIDEEKRRETWPETVGRYMNFMEEHLKENNEYTLPEETKRELHDAILNLEVMPSMRALMTAGKALKRENVAGYNCSYIPVDHPRAFDEALYILMCGTGVGFSVERNCVEKLPVVAETFTSSSTVIRVDDSKQGWASSFKQLIGLLYLGEIPQWDLSELRPRGARLKTFGGRSSGPGPLDDLFKFATSTFKAAAGRKLTPLECHDLMCKVGDVVVSGGVRRSALISLSNVTDDQLRKAKFGNWWDTYGHRALANNSAVYTRRPDVELFMREWLALVESKSGERGIFNRQASALQAAKNGRRETEGIQFGTNPCSEIILRPYQFCNLTEVVVRSTDTASDISRKVRLATVLGTLQSTLTNFKYIRKIWTDNTEEERLLGVSLTGIMDNPTLMSINNLGWWKSIAVKTNSELAGSIGIPVSTAITCVKPSGTVSQLVDSASGIHTRHAPYYIRSVRGDTMDPVSKFLMDAGVPNEPAIGKEGQTQVFYFPQKSPEGSVVDMPAMEQLEFWKRIQEYWCEHKPSVTITVKDHEWMKVGAWVYENFDVISGISFLPDAGNHTYKQAPYEACSKEAYEEALKGAPEVIDWSLLKNYEHEDNTASSQTLACTGAVCEIVNISDN